MAPEVGLGTEAFDEEQRAVIGASVDARLIVEAGPGTGKTATACARVARLLSNGVTASGILLVSFTRTAVVELRTRIRALARSVDAADAVRIATVDSEAWRLRYGFGMEEVDSLFGGFDESIDKILSLLQKPSDEVLDYFERMSHVIVDEAQDLTDKRAQLVLAIISLLSPDAGVTIFGDPHQAIYGWRGADDDGEEPDVATPSLLQLADPKKYKSLSLKTVYRAREEGVRALFEATREIISGGAAGARCSKLLEFLRAKTSTPPADALDEIDYGDEADCSDLLVLYRTRVEVLRRSAELLRVGRPHRIRIPGYPRSVLPAISQVLMLHNAPTLDEKTFVEKSLVNGGDEESARALWASIRARAMNENGGRLDVRQLCMRLTKNPPEDLLVRDGGTSGPVLSTVHASKGREARRVLLSLSPRPQASRSEVAAQEEARVLYVAATRGHEVIWHVDSEFRPTTKTASGRSFVMTRGGALFELGLDGDVEFQPPSTDSEFASWRDALKALAIGDELYAIREGPPWVYRLYSPALPNVSLAQLARKVESELWDCARLVQQRSRPAQVIANIFVTGFQSIFISEAGPFHELPTPVEAPIVRGFPHVSFQVPST